MREVFWAIAGTHGLYCGTAITRVDAIAQHVHGRFQAPSSLYPSARGGKLNPVQKSDWQKCRRMGDRAVKVLVHVLDESSEGRTDV